MHTPMTCRYADDHSYRIEQRRWMAPGLRSSSGLPEFRFKPLLWILGLFGQLAREYQST
jgi:hypothetical protein